MDNRNEKLTHNLIYNSISLNENENILVEVIGEDGLELANEIIKQAKIINAKPHLNIINYEDLRNFLINATKEDIIEYGKKDYENKKLCNFRSKKLKRKYLQIFHGKKIYIGNYSDRTRADISYCHSASVDL